MSDKYPKGILHSLAKYIEFAENTKRFADVGFYNDLAEHIATLTEQVRAQDKWVSVDDVSAITATQLVYVAANDIVSQWVDVIEAYVCPEYGGVMWIDLDGEDYVPIITAWMPVTLPTPPKEAE